MSQIKVIKLPNGQIILMETDETVEIPELTPSSDAGMIENGILTKGWTETANNQLLNLVSTIESFAEFIPKAIKNAVGTNVDKTVFKFGIKLGGEAGIPYITKGSAEGNIEITVECSFPNKVTLNAKDESMDAL